MAAAESTKEAQIREMIDAAHPAQLLRLLNDIRSPVRSTHAATERLQ
ncbi:MAG: hypothetical protein AAF718_07055 [Pseudomonadota bacterium]